MSCNRVKQSRCPRHIISSTRADSKSLQGIIVRVDRAGHDFRGMRAEFRYLTRTGLLRTQRFAAGYSQLLLSLRRMKSETRATTYAPRVPLSFHTVELPAERLVRFPINRDVTLYLISKFPRQRQRVDSRFCDEIREFHDVDCRKLPTPRFLGRKELDLLIPEVADCRDHIELTDDLRIADILMWTTVQHDKGEAKNERSQILWMPRRSFVVRRSCGLGCEEAQGSVHHADQPSPVYEPVGQPAAPADCCRTAGEA